jgi:hypothetical protein
MSKPPKSKREFNKSDYITLLTLDEFDEPDDLDEFNTYRIDTKREFNTFIKRDNSYIVITNTAHHNKLHKISCRFVKENNFETKVIKHQCKYGHYYWLGDLGCEELLYQASACSHCMK